MKNNAGFSLMELSIVLVIIGIITSGGIQFFDGTIHIVKNRVTRDRLKVLETAIDTYILIYRGLPCPAAIKQKADDNDYGTESCFVESHNPTDKKVVKSAGDFLVGTIPVVNLSLDKQLLLDGWNSKFVFAVAAKYTYHDTDGGINANNKFMSDTLSLDSGPNNQKYMYAIISNGLDKNGAYSKNGLLVRSLKQTDPKRCLTNTYDGFDPEKLVETGTNENCDDQTLLISRSQKIMELQLVSEIPCDLEKNLEKVLKHCEHSMNGIKLTEFNTKDFPSYKLLYPGQKISSNYKDFIWEETIGGESYKSIPRKIACTVECKPGSRLKAYKDILLLQQ